MTKPTVELLAPAGKWDVLEAVIGAGADAVYLGGKRFNMRLLKPEFNFSDRELIRAVNYLHERGKSLYVTVNNLYLDEELNELGDYLSFLQEIGVDALIVQDLGLVELYRKRGLSLPLHASVQMGAASSAGLRFFEDIGFSRIILSKNMRLDEISAIHEASPLGIEYFAHGDLCVSHAGQCYMSSYMKGEGGNRGRCVKPCRWAYRLKCGDTHDDYQYRLAYKDLCVYDLVPRLVEAGVTSFKIEGRMREPGYLSHLVGIYRRALDEVIHGTRNLNRNEDIRILEQKRIRDFTYGNLLGQPGPDAIAPGGEREPFFVSTAFRLASLDNKIKQFDYAEPSQEAGISVKVSDMEGVAAACRKGVQRIILPGEDLRQSQFRWQDTDRQAAIATAHGMGIEVFLETPRIVTEKDWAGIKLMMTRWGGQLDGFIVNDWGSLQLGREKGYVVHGGYGLNVFNTQAAEFLMNQGLERVTASLELGATDLAVIASSGVKVEVLTQGPLCGMVSDICLARACEPDCEDVCRITCASPDYGLEDALGQQYRLKSDENCRTYIYYPYDLCHIKALPLLIAAGLRFIRIDGQFYSGQDLNKMIEVYQSALKSIANGQWEIRYLIEQLGDLCPAGLMEMPDQVRL